MTNLYTTIGTHVPDNLIADISVPILTKALKLKAGQGALGRGTVLGIITEGGLAVPVDKTAENGSRSADCILTDNVDTGADPEGDAVVAVAYRSGHFNRKALIFGADNTAADHETRLRELGIFLSDNIPY